MASIRAEDIVVEFPVARGFRHLVHRVRNRATGGQLDDRRGVVRALDGVSVTLREGDRLGVIGHNGSGKSTLLRVLGGIYTPAAGAARIAGRVSALFNAAPGLEIDDNGWQNITNCGLYLGMTRAEIARKADEIADFTELGEFLDMPVRTYSSGMLARLSFAIATAIDPEILLLDEALGTGDAGFAIKARDRLTAMIARSAILVMASHSPSELTELCVRGLYLEKGKMLADGEIAAVIAQYQDTLVMRAAADDQEALQRALALSQQLVRQGEAVPLALEEQSLRAALKIQPGDAPMLMRLCQVLMLQGKPVPAAYEIEALEAAARVHPDDAAMAGRLRQLRAAESGPAGEVGAATQPSRRETAAR
jgi:ABC-type polysaccharide/polyol phosphate transport system ATPase subunit